MLEVVVFVDVVNDDGDELVDKGIDDRRVFVPHVPFVQSAHGVCVSE